MGISVVYKQTHTSKSTVVYICLSSSNKCIRCCHTNINYSSFNGAFIYANNESKSVLAQDLDDCRDNLRNLQCKFLVVAYILLISYGSLLWCDRL